MSTVAEKTQVSPEDLLRMLDEKAFELIEGMLVERNVSVLSSWIGLQIARLLANHAADHQLGWVFGSDNGYQCFSGQPNLVRRPDASFVQRNRLQPDQIGDGWLQVVPDLIVEVISPNDLAYELDEKIDLFLRAGVSLIWVVNPDVRTVRIVRADRSSTILLESEDISGEDILPGFVCQVSSIFPPKSAKA